MGGLGQAGEVLPGMRFMHYPMPGEGVSAHVDQSRQHPACRTPSTYSFLLYLTDCSAGGELQLFESKAGDVELLSSSALALHDRERKVIATVKPRRGRLLLMPHECLHSAADTVDV